MAYDINVRKEALNYCKMGWTDEEVCNTLDISRQTLTNWKKLLFSTGSLNKKRVVRRSRGPYKYKREQIEVLLDQSDKSPVNSKNTKNKYQEIQSSDKKGKKKKKKKKKKNKLI